MEDKVILLVLFNNNILRTNLRGYESYICDTDVACNLIYTSAKYFGDKDKSINVTKEDLDAIFKAEYNKDSEELFLWEEVKNSNISDISAIEPAVIRRIKQQIKDYFLAEAFDNDVYDREKLEELYDVLSRLSNLELDVDSSVEDIAFDNTDELVDIYSSKNKEGIKFFDNRISDTLSTKSFDYGTVNVITAAPGNGKTMLIMNQAVYAASQGYKVLHLAIGDLTRKQVIIRLLAIITKIPMQQISMLNKEQFKKFVVKAQNKYKDIFSNLSCKCILPNTLNSVEIVKLIKKEQETKNIHFDQIAIDYDGNIETVISSLNNNTNKSGKSMYYEGSEMYNLFSQFAKQNETVVWVLSQPKIAYWNQDKIPLEGLNDSSKKQHIADFIMSIGRKVKDEPQVTFFISKNRNGESNKSFYSKVDGSTQTFEPINEW